MQAYRFCELWRAYEICEMDVSIGIEKHVVWFDITMYDALTMYISQRTAELGDPESDCVFGECLSGDVEPQVATTHEVDDEIPGTTSALEQSRGITIDSVQRTCTLCLGSCSAGCR